VLVTFRMGSQSPVMDKCDRQAVNGTESSRTYAVGLVSISRLATSKATALYLLSIVVTTLVLGQPQREIITSQSMAGCNYCYCYCYMVQDLA